MSQKCILYSKDTKLSERISGALFGVTDPVWSKDQDTLFPLLERYRSVVIFIDLSQQGALNLVDRLERDFELSVIITLGENRTDPMIAAQSMDSVFLAESIDCPGREIEKFYRVACKFMAQKELCNSLERRLHSAKAVVREVVRPDDASFLSGLKAFSRIHSLPVLLEQGLQMIKEHHAVGSLGVFLKSEKGGVFRFQNGLRCPIDVSDVVVSNDSALVKWLRYHPCVIDRRMIRTIEEDDGDYALADQLRNTLTSMCADAIFPLYARELLGWIIVGRSTFGNVIVESEATAISHTVDQLACAVENSILHAKIREQRQHLEIILNALDIGIVMFDSDLMVQWLNNSACTIFGRNMEDLIKQSCKVLGSELSSRLLENYSASTSVDTFSWSPRASNREYLVEVHGVDSGTTTSTCGFMFIQDFTDQPYPKGEGVVNELEEKDARRIPTVSHKMRDPLAALQTFVQLLPERHGDPDFVTQFIDIATNAIVRLREVTYDLEEIPIPEAGRMSMLVDANEMIDKAIGKGAKVGVIDRAEVYLTRATGLMLKIVEPEVLISAFVDVFRVLGKGIITRGESRIWVEVFLEKDGNEDFCVFSFKGQRAAFASITSAPASKFENGLNYSDDFGGTKDLFLTSHSDSGLLGEETDWIGLKTKVASLLGNVNYGYNKNSSFVTLHIPVN
jgi:PAS domain-containing protein